MSMSAADRAWLKHKARPSLLSTITNLKRAHEYGYALGHSAERRGTAVVVGSGPSLSKSLALVSEWQSHGALVITTNTGLPALAKASVVPDVVVTREVVDVGSHLEHKARCVCVDIAAAPSVWDAAERSGAEVRWFVGAAMQYFDLAAKLGVRPLYGGGAALTGAVALAEEWGATQVVLVGVDLAFASDGAGYDASSAWGGYRASIDGDLALISGAGYDAMREQSDRGRIPPPPRAQRTIKVTAYGGHGEVVQLLTWADQMRWLEMFAKRRELSGMSLVNSTGGGARIEGWPERMPDCIRPQDAAPARQVTAAEVADVLADIRRQCSTVGALGATVCDPHGVVAAVPGWLSGNALVEAVAAPDIVEQRGLGLPAKKAIIAQCASLESAAAHVSSILEAT